MMNLKNVMILVFGAVFASGMTFAADEESGVPEIRFTVDTRALKTARAGEELAIYYEENETVTMTVPDGTVTTLVEGEEKAFERWGFTAEEINRFDVPELAFFAPEGGVFLSAVAWDGNADNCGFLERDIVTEVDGVKVRTVKEMSELYGKALSGLPSKSKMSFSLLRKGRPVQLVLNYLTDTEKEMP